MKKQVPTESEEQQTLFRWAAMQSGKYPELALMFHIPNEGKLTLKSAESAKRRTLGYNQQQSRGERHGFCFGVICALPPAQIGTQRNRDAEWERRCLC